MDECERFVATENVFRFLRWVEQEPHDGQRTVWKGLMLAEEDRFGAISERLDIAERCRGTCLNNIKQQQARIAEMDGDHPHLHNARLLLANLFEVTSLLNDRISKLKESLG